MTFLVKYSSGRKSMGNAFAVSVRIENGKSASLSLQSTCQKKKNTMLFTQLRQFCPRGMSFFEHGPEAVDSLHIGQGHQQRRWSVHARH